MRKLTFLSLFTIIVALGIYGYLEKPDWLSFVPWFKKVPLTQEEIAVKKKACEARFEEAKRLTEEVRAGGQRVTDPKVFFSSEVGACLVTYLIKDPELPDAGTYNSFVIHNLDRGKDLYSKARNTLQTYQDYLNKMDELDK